MEALRIEIHRCTWLETDKIKIRIMAKEDIYLVRKIDQNGTAHPHFTLNIEGVVKLLNMATPRKCKFEIEKIEKI